MPLTTRCRHCGRFFPVYATQLRTNRGRVPCPQCGRRFNAVAGLIDEHVPHAETAVQRRHPAHRAPTAIPTPDLLPDLLEAPPPRWGLGRWLWGLGVLVLTLTLAAQAAWWRRGELLRYPGVQTALAHICPFLGCRVPLPRLPGTIEILQSSLAADPVRPQALLLRLVLVSRAVAAQRPPLLALELFDEGGALLGADRFAPEQYLADGSPALLEGLIPNRPVRGALDITLAEARPSGFRVRLL
jgi:predicted Zn finger-like uncharacterized protein